MKTAFKETSKRPSLESISWTRINNDTNGNPRYVCHFLQLLKTEEYNRYEGDIEKLYNAALKRAKTIGGRKFHNRQYGGGIVFQSYNLADTERSIHELMTANAPNLNTKPTWKSKPRTPIARG